MEKVPLLLCHLRNIDLKKKKEETVQDQKFVTVQQRVQEGAWSREPANQKLREMIGRQR